MTVQTPVRRTHAVRRLQQITETTSCAVELHGQSVRRDTALGRECGRAFARQVYTTNKVAVLLGQLRQEPHEACAEQPHFLRIRRCFAFRSEARQRALAGIAAAVKIDDRAPKNPVKPAHGVGFAGLPFRANGFHHALLHGIARKLDIAQPRACEAGEGVEVFQQKGGGLAL